MTDGEEAGSSAAEAKEQVQDEPAAEPKDAKEEAPQEAEADSKQVVDESKEEAPTEAATEEAESKDEGPIRILTGELVLKVCNATGLKGMAAESKDAESESKEAGDTAESKETGDAAESKEAGDAEAKEAGEVESEEAKAGDTDANGEGIEDTELQFCAKFTLNNSSQHTGFGAPSWDQTLSGLPINDCDIDAVQIELFTDETMSAESKLDQAEIFVADLTSEAKDGEMSEMIRVPLENQGEIFVCAKVTLTKEEAKPEAAEGAKKEGKEVAPPPEPEPEEPEPPRRTSYPIVALDDVKWDKWGTVLEQLGDDGMMIRQKDVNPSETYGHFLGTYALATADMEVKRGQTRYFEVIPRRYGGSLDAMYVGAVRPGLDHNPKTSYHLTDDAFFMSLSDGSLSGHGQLREQEEVLYVGGGGREEAARVLKVHREDAAAALVYTILLEGTGMELQTDRAHLKKKKASAGASLQMKGWRWKNNKLDESVMRPVETGDRVGVLVDLEYHPQGTIRFFVNGHEIGTGFKDVVGPLVFGVQTQHAGHMAVLKPDATKEIADWPI